MSDGAVIHPDQQAEAMEALAQIIASAAVRKLQAKKSAARRGESSAAQNRNTNDNVHGKTTKRNETNPSGECQRVAQPATAPQCR